MPQSEYSTDRLETIKRLASQKTAAPFTDWEGIPLHRSCFEGENTIEVFAGTSAPQGGNAEHGARTVFVLNDVNKTNFESIRVLTRSDMVPSGLVVILGGDAEAATFANALEFAATTIRRQLRANHAGVS